MHPTRVYFLNSTLILYTSTFLYLLFAAVWEVHSVSLFFATLYCLQVVFKYSYKESLYRSPYFSLSFNCIDIISGPLALGFCIDNSIRSKGGVHIGCVMIVSKVLLCRLNIKILKELTYVFKSTLRYFRLSVSLALCFVVTSYFLFEPYSKYFKNIGESLYSMYQLCTFDGWINDSAKDIRNNLSEYWLLFFALYFVIMLLCYLIAILSFFIIYYSNEDLKQDFEFKEEKFITVEDLAERLNLRKDNKKTLVAKAELIILYYALVSTLEWIIPSTVQLRPLFLTASLVYSIGYMTFRLRRYGWCWNSSHFLLFFRGILCSLIFVVLVIMNAPLNYLIGLYLFSCVFDVIRHNILLQTVLRRFYKNIVEYLLLLSLLCYFFAVLLFRRKTLTKLNQQREKFLDLYLLNIQIIGFDGWGDTAHGIIQQKMGWVWCLIFLVFIGAMTISNMFLGEILVQMTPYIKEILKIYKLNHIKLEYTDLKQLQASCLKQVERERGLRNDLNV